MTQPTRPSWAPTIYHDGANLYLEFSNHAIRFPFTEGGLSKALKQIPHIASAPGYVTGQSNILTKLLPKLARATKYKREVRNFSPEQRAAAAEAIRKMKVKGP